LTSAQAAYADAILEHLMHNASLLNIAGASMREIRRQ